jgi:hypothetical protein
MDIIVRDVGDAWQIVLQTDHAVLAGEFAQAWGNATFEAPRPLRAVTTATARHDDGWAIWERAPSLLQQNGTPKPRNFLDVQVLPHLTFYRAQIAAVLDEDEYAAALVAMHGCGIYNGRYGTDPVLKLTFAEAERQAVDDFTEEQEERVRQIVADLAISDEERWTNYRLLQVFDRLSLYFCTGAVDESATLSPVPTSYGGTDTELRIVPEGQWAARLDPYPFGESPARFTLLVRTVPKRDWSDLDAFRRDFFGAAVVQTPVALSAA